MTITLVGYVLMVKYGPKLMELRKSNQLPKVLIVYNLTQVILNVALGVYVRFGKFKYDDFFTKTSVLGSSQPVFCERFQL